MRFVLLPVFSATALTFLPRESCVTSSPKQSGGGWCDAIHRIALPSLTITLRSCDCRWYDCSHSPFSRSFPVAAAIDCFQCDAVSDLYCGDRFDAESAERLGIVPKSCSAIHDAAYCVKTTGMFGGRAACGVSLGAFGVGGFCMSRRMDEL